ncbi:DUF4870 domain-containing protein [Marinirhabdus gelatinilytica]|uniref:DUF4870 domain-containing protein n=1 Tax=Marinirhabdus gelatinilytica TaxID=1703343 RepID=A0A370QAK2_9FLAO|nr:DUF4870 domain-containing protein [Marinirhabdus gelatinilytica]RDK85404.1 hypothetical protein C8D94_103229 [Marinirhabdus gelatinilytica]
METQQTVEEGKTMAIIAYVTVIGLIIAFIINNDKKNSFTAYHIRQSLGIYILWFALSLAHTALSFIVHIPLLSWIIYICMIALVVIGLIAAMQGERKPVPIVGEKFQEWFKNIG